MSHVLTAPVSSPLGSQCFNNVTLFLTGPSNDTLPAEPQGGVRPARPRGVVGPQHRHLPLRHPHREDVQGPPGEDGRQDQIVEETLVRFRPPQEELRLLRRWGHGDSPATFTQNNQHTQIQIRGITSRTSSCVTIHFSKEEKPALMPFINQTHPMILCPFELLFTWWFNCCVTIEIHTEASTCKCPNINKSARSLVHAVSAEGS